MRTIYAIQCHNITPAILYTLGKIGRSDDAVALVHVDLKSGHLPLPKFGNNIIYCENRIDVRWGGISQVKCTINLMKEALKHDFDYFSLISGDDVLTKNISEFHDFLDKNSGSEFIGFSLDDASLSEARRRVECWYPSFFYQKESSILLRAMKRLVGLCHIFGMFSKRKNRLRRQYYKGSNWFTISRGLVEFILEYLSDVDPDYFAMFQHSYCCDEVFFHTIIGDSQHFERIYQNTCPSLDDNSGALRYVDWKSGPDFPKVLGKNDLIMARMQNVFFARKVDSKLSVDALTDLLG